MTKYSYLKYPIFGILLMTIMTACNIRQKNTYFNSPSDIVTDTIKQVYVVNDQGASDFYRLKPGDQIVIKNLQDREFGANKTGNTNITSTTKDNLLSFEVKENGTVKVPSLDAPVKVAGMTRREVTQKMQEIFEGPTKLNNPIIEVTVINLKVTLLGEFVRQGNFYLERDNIRLIDIIGEAGGLTKEADKRTLKIIRGDQAKPEIIYVNLTDINSLARGQKLTLQNNDIILISQLKSAAAATQLQNMNNFVQPILVLLNLALLIFTITR